MLRLTNLAEYSVDDWEQEFSEIYGGVDSNRTPAEMWLLMMEDAAGFAEAIRLDHYGSAQKKIARVFGWVCSFVNRCRSITFRGTAFHLQKPLSLMVWDKYPYACSTCAQPRCVCPVRRAELEALNSTQKEHYKARMLAEPLSAARLRVEKMPRTLDEMTAMFNFIYKGAHFNLSLEAIVLHLLEEVGEVASCIRAIREKDGRRSDDTLRHDLEDEIADIVSWIASWVSKLDYILGASGLMEHAGSRPQGGSLKLSEIVWKEFADPSGQILWCIKCQSRPCKCIRSAL